MFRILTKALIVKDKDILLLKRKNGSFASGLWDLPGGKLEFGESPEESLLREIYEETKLKVRIDAITSLSSGLDCEKKKQYITVVYLCTYISGEVTLNGEHSDYEWININKANTKETVYYVKESLDRYLMTLSTKG